MGSDGQGHDAGPKDAASPCAKPLAKLPLDCQVTFMPTYSSIYTNLFAKTCGAASTGSSCHGPSGKQSGLLLSGKDAAYDSLLGNAADHRARVIPGDPECSVLEQRLESDDPNFRMPLGAMKLADGELCAVRQWIANGASKQ